MAPARIVQVSDPSSTLPDSAHVPPLPTTRNNPPPPHTNHPTSYTITTDHLATFQAAIDGLQYQNDTLQSQTESLHSAIEAIARSQTFLTHQFAAFQNTMLNRYVGSQPPPTAPAVATAHSNTTLGCFTPPQHTSQPFVPPPSPSNTQLSFGSFPPLPTTPPPVFPTAPPPVPIFTPPPHPNMSHPPPNYSTISTTTPQPNYPPPPNTSHPYQRHHIDPPEPHYRPPKIDLPRFHGEDVVGWLAMADRFLRVNRVPYQDRIQVAASHFGPDQSVWMNAFELRHPLATWEEFVVALTSRFGAGSTADFKGALSHLQQTGSVEEFTSNFTKLSCRAPDWPDHELLPMFIEGLRPELRHDVRALNPPTLEEAQRIARLFEYRNRELRPAATFRPRPPSYGFPRSSLPTHNPTTTPHIQPPTTTATTRPNHTNPVQPTPPPNRFPRFRQLSPAEQRERRAKNLCFNCDEQYSENHVCRRTFMAILDCHEPPPEPTEPDTQPPPTDETLEEQQLYPLHKITDTKISDMMRLRGSINNTSIDVFIDCGSTMNFLNPAVVTKLGIMVAPSGDLKFTTASGHLLTPSGVAHGITVDVQDYTFTDSFLLLPVAGCDLVLGAQWLDTLGFIGWHFRDKIMVFVANGRRHILKGVNSDPQRNIEAAEILDLIPSEHLDAAFMLCAVMPEAQPVNLHPELTQLLTRFGPVFAAPVGLPPFRAINHKILLLPNTGPVNVRPYKYANSQKDELEAQVDEMLAQGIIRPSTSPFSSPVLLVRKNEGTWRFCVDYRQLNEVTVKDRFPIPMVDELLSELHGATIFSKLDLRSGFHQIRMHEKDIPKTAFRTHEGHYEFVVMPFGLSNAPSTFQALMNYLFRALLRRHVLVFLMTF
uniref:uncharacterized protein LOC105351720 n=1 Tax=Fragaria vesca subsp. vesca TaxID=101020 RepID=UPI0005C8A8E7|nr:PREDICTED: uncharacterized protein LOC105351720 [Fragaria vesca subsp. vesca]